MGMIFCYKEISNAYASMTPKDHPRSAISTSRFECVVLSCHSTAIFKTTGTNLHPKKLNVISNSQDHLLERFTNKEFQLILTLKSDSNHT